MRHFDRDPTRFFSVVGAPYVPEQRSEPYYRPRSKIGFAAGATIFCAAVLVLTVFSQTGFARILEVAKQQVVEVAQQVVR